VFAPAQPIEMFFQKRGQSCTVIDLEPASGPTMLVMKWSAVAFRTHPFFRLSNVTKLP
jgi:hypothetical protein